GYHFLLHPRYDLLQGQTGRVESERIGRRPQRRVAPRAVALVARRDLPGERRLVDGLAAPAELHRPPACPLGWVGSQVRLHRRARHPPRPYVAPPHPRAAPRAARALARDQPLANHRPRGDARCQLTCLDAADLGRNVRPVHGEATAIPRLESQAPHQPGQCLVVVQGDATAMCHHTHGAVHRAGVGVAEAPGEGAARRALAGASGSVDGDHAPSHHRPSTDAPSSARLEKNPGNETATHSGSSISTPRSARSPATANAMAMRWSPRLSTWPPRSAPAPRPRTASPSAVTQTLAPSDPSCSSAARRSLSFTRSSWA